MFYLKHFLIFLIKSCKAHILLTFKAILKNFEDEPRRLVHIAQKANGPVYVYDAAKIKSQYQRLTNAFRGVEQLRLHYATKALNNISILKYIQGLGAGLDTVSIQEVQLGLKAGFDPSTIIFTPNGVSLSEIEAVAKIGVQINIDNLSILEQFGDKYYDVRYASALAQ